MKGARFEEGNVANHEPWDILVKSFLDRRDAELFAAGKAVQAPVGTPSKFYAVAVGAPTGVFENWSDVQEAITGVKGPKFRKCDTRADAVAFIRANGDKDAVQALKDSGEFIDEFDEDESEDDSDDDGEEEDDLLAEQLQVQTKPAKRSSRGKVQIWTDGASRGNGKVGARAGYGVFFGENDPRNLSERLKLDPQTNQRAELMAIQRALEVVPVTQHVEIFTDSQYSLNSVTTWAKGWEQNNWKTSTGKDVMNTDIIKVVVAKIDERAQAGARTLFEWVKGHGESAGNIAADSLAVLGCSK